MGMDDRPFQTLRYTLGASFEGCRRVRKGVPNLIRQPFVIMVFPIGRPIKRPVLRICLGMMLPSYS